jgi:hypothetical protein
MRDNLFDKIVNNENDFTELLCNMFKYEDFKKIFTGFIGINTNYKVSVETQFKTHNRQKNGRPDIAVYYEDAIIFIESKIGNTKLTKNQPEGYIEELKLQKESYKELIFLIPGKYAHRSELDGRIARCELSGIKFSIKTWEEFFEYIKTGKIYLENIVINEYYNLLKSRFGYEIVSFSGEELEMMKENARVMIKSHALLKSIGAQLTHDMYSVTHANTSSEIGIFISDEKGADLGWFGVWFSLCEKTGDCFVYTLAESGSKKYFNNLNKISREVKLYEFPTDSVRNGREIYKYVCFDDILCNKTGEENSVFIELKGILTNIVKTK